ncbi:olfactory receptor 51I2-like [Osmerus mordax]|uniref:olfactory receptor 51I2-like n=1 Tax=Osmerus mordax TaxID=8014 RepID=UPI00350ED684
MENSSELTWFKLTAYSDMGSMRPFYFTLLILMYFSVITFNVLTIGLVIFNRRLHEPMYFLLCSLFVNELYGSTGLFPWLIHNMLLDVHHISRFHCILQIFCVHTYASIEFTNLAVMAYDRYVSICYPLRYIEMMSPMHMYLLIAFIWIYSFGKFSVLLSMTVKLRLCGNVIAKVYCDNYSLVKLACEDTTLNNVYGSFTMVLSVGLPLILIIYSYAKILNICYSSSKQSQQKALNTCIPHIMSLLNFAVGCLFEVAQSRFNMQHVPLILRIFLSVYFLIICPILNPIIFGVKTAKIRESFRRFCIKLWP